MPKLFPIHLQVEELFVGKILRALNAMHGVARVDLAIEHPPAKPNGAGPLRNAQKFDQKAEDYILELLAQQDKATKDLRIDFTNVGRRPGSTSSALNALFKTALIKKAPDGKTWTLTKKAKDRLRWHKRKK